MENVDVANHKIASHGPDRGSFIDEVSTTKEWKGSGMRATWVVTHKFKTLFRDMELRKGVG